jgi:hypothetical protein
MHKLSASYLMREAEPDKRFEIGRRKTRLIYAPERRILKLSFARYSLVNVENDSNSHAACHSPAMTPGRQ